MRARTPSHVPAESADPIVERLSRTPGLSHLTLIPLAKTSSVVIQAELDPVHADESWRSSMRWG